VEVNFFVMQTYKTLVLFVTSWLVLLLGEEVRWTSWGIVSGLFWVPGAACGIYGIRDAGVAIAVGTWSSIQVVSSCIFGIVIFQESVKDVKQTMLAFLVLMVGLVGMSVYSEMPANVKTQSSNANYQPVAKGGRMRPY
jgi:glucose uptake protein GlcU